MAAKRQVPIATKVVKFVVGKRKSIDLWRTSRPTKKSLGVKPVLNTGVAKWPPKCRKFVTAFWVPKRARISTRFGTHICPGSSLWPLFLFDRTQNGHGKMATKREVPMGYQSSKICQKLTKFGRHVKDIKTNKEVSWAKTYTQNGRGKMTAKVQKVHHSVLNAKTCLDFSEIWHARSAWQYAQTIFLVWQYSKWAWQNGRQSAENETFQCCYSVFSA